MLISYLPEMYVMMLKIYLEIDIFYDPDTIDKYSNSRVKNLLLYLI